MEGFPGVCKTRIWTLRDSTLKSVQILPKQSSCKGIPTERVCVQGSYKQQGSGQGRTMHARTKKRCKRRLCVCDSDEPRSNTCTLLHNQPPQLGGLKQHPLTTSPQFCRLETQLHSLLRVSQGGAGIPGAWGPLPRSSMELE